MAVVSSDDIWKDELKNFISTHYHVDKVKCPDIGILFNGHGTTGGNASTSYGISYENIRKVFSNSSKGQRSPSQKMKVAFIQLKDIQAKGELMSFPDMLLRGYTHPVFSAEVLASYHMWTLTYELDPVLFPNITYDSPYTDVQRWVDMFLEYCRGRFNIDNKLFASKNLSIFRDQYLHYVFKVTPTVESPII